MLRTHKIALDLNNKQRTHLSRCAGVSRFAYNWALAEWDSMYKAWSSDKSLKKPSQKLLRKMLNAIKREQFPWMLEVTKCAPQEAIIDLGKAFTNFFKGRASRPVFKKKGVNDSFRVSSGFFSISGKKIRLPNIGWLRMREELRFKGRIVSVTVSRSAGRWYASIVCELPEPVHSASEDKGKIIGVDAGVGAYVTSEGVVYETPRSYRKAEKKLRRAQQSLSRKRKGSKNRGKQRLKVAKTHARVSDKRADFLHKTTTGIVCDAETVVVEDLNVKGMLKNRRLSKSIADASFGEFRRQIAYKAEASGKTMILANRYYPSSKLCSACGAKAKSLTLGMRKWVCPECGVSHDRDRNASINLKKYAESSPVSVCGEFFASATPHVSGAIASNLCEAETKQQIAS